MTVLVGSVIIIGFIGSILSVWLIGLTGLVGSVILIGFIGSILSVGLIGLNVFKVYFFKSILLGTNLNCGNFASPILLL